MKTSAIFAAAATVLAVTTSASAQDAEVKAQGQVQGQATTPVVTVAGPPAARVEATIADDTPDHERFIGHFAVGYFGISQLPIATGMNGAGGNLPATAIAPSAGTVNAPIIGGRYWFQRNIGVDAGIGIGMASGSTETVIANGTVDTDHASLFGFALHGGVPLAFAYGKHYTFELVPEATLGITSGTIKGNPAVNGGAAATPDVNLSGFRLDVGARVGAEIHFGFIGVPELALEGSVGLYLRRNTIKAKQDQTSVSDGSTTISTSVGSDPWALFVNNISALYYF